MSYVFVNAVSLTKKTNLFELDQMHTSANSWAMRKATGVWCTLVPVHHAVRSIPILQSLSGYSETYLQVAQTVAAGVSYSLGWQDCHINAKQQQAVLQG